MAPNGDICVNTLKKDWSPETTLKHVLQVIRCLLIVPFPESSLNDEAGKLFMESFEEFARRARIMTDVHAERIGSTDTTGASKLTEVGSTIETHSTANVFGISNNGSGVAGSCASSNASSSSSNDKIAKKTKSAKTKGLKRL